MLKTLRTIVLPALLGLGILALIGLAGSALVLYREARDVHPVLGYLVAGSIAAAVFLLAVLPVVRVLRLPRGLRRPERSEGREWDRYLRSYGKRLAANPRVRDGHDGAVALRAALDRAAADSDGAPGLQVEIERALGYLDERCREVIAGHAAAVFTATAVSQSGRLDAAIVLSAQLRMVREIAELYFQRPGSGELLRLYANVGSAVFVAGEMEDSELLAVLGAPATAGLTGLFPFPGSGPLISLVVASLLDGSANAFLTLRVGILARRYCGLRLESNRRIVSRSASLEAAGLLTDVVARGAQRVAALTLTGVARGVASGPRRAGEAAWRTTGKIAGTALKGGGLAAQSMAEAWDSIARMFKTEPRESQTVLPGDPPPES